MLRYNLQTVSSTVSSYCQDPHVKLEPTSRGNHIISVSEMSLHMNHSFITDNIFLSHNFTFFTLGNFIAAKAA